MLVSVIGGNKASSEILKEAEELGRGLARRGLTVICGGLGGVMEAVCRGARAAGGRTVGILPGTRAAAANAYVDISIPTGIGLARNAIVALAGEIVVAVNGRHGTLTEIGYALNSGKPVIGIRTWEIEGVRAVPDAETALRTLDELLPDLKRDQPISPKRSFSRLPSGRNGPTPRPG